MQTLVHLGHSVNEQHCRVFTLDSGTLAVDDPVQPVRNSDIIQLVHGMTERPLNRYVLRYSRRDWTTIEQVCTQVLTVWLRDCLVCTVFTASTLVSAWLDDQPLNSQLLTSNLLIFSPHVGQTAVQSTVLWSQYSCVHDFETRTLNFHSYCFFFSWCRIC